MALPGSRRRHPVMSAIREQTGPSSGGAGIDVPDPKRRLADQICCAAQRGIPMWYGVTLGLRGAHAATQIHRASRWDGCGVAARGAFAAV
jgi:hypothetical protein